MFAKQHVSECLPILRCLCRDRVCFVVFFFFLPSILSSFLPPPPISHPSSLLRSPLPFQLKTATAILHFIQPSAVTTSAQDLQSLSKCLSLTRIPLWLISLLLLRCWAKLVRNLLDLLLLGITTLTELSLQRALRRHLPCLPRRCRLLRSLRPLARSLPLTFAVSLSPVLALGSVLQDT